MTDIKKTPIPQRLKNVSNDHPYVAGAIDIVDDTTGNNQQEINADTYRKNEVYSKEETNIVISRTPETDVVVLDVPEGSTAADVLDNVPVEDRPNKLFRVKNDSNTHYDEYGWTGEEWALLASKDYAISEEAEKGDRNPISGSAVVEHVESIVCSHMASFGKDFTEEFKKSILFLQFRTKNDYRGEKLYIKRFGIQTDLDAFYIYIHNPQNQVIGVYRVTETAAGGDFSGVLNVVLYNVYSEAQDPDSYIVATLDFDLISGEDEVVYTNEDVQNGICPVVIPTVYRVLPFENTEGLPSNAADENTSRCAGVLDWGAFQNFSISKYLKSVVLEISDQTFLSHKLVIYSSSFIDDNYYIQVYDLTEDEVFGVYYAKDAINLTGEHTIIMELASSSPSDRWSRIRACVDFDSFEVFGLSASTVSRAPRILPLLVSKNDLGLLPFIKAIRVWLPDDEMDVDYSVSTLGYYENDNKFYFRLGYIESGEYVHYVYGTKYYLDGVPSDGIETLSFIMNKGRSSGNKLYYAEIDIDWSLYDSNEYDISVKKHLPMDIKPTYLLGEMKGVIDVDEIGSKIYIPEGCNIYGKNCTINMHSEGIRISLFSNSSLNDITFVDTSSAAITEREEYSAEEIEEYDDLRYLYRPILSMEDLHDITVYAIFGHNSEQLYTIKIEENVVNARVSGCTFKYFNRPAVYDGMYTDRHTTPTHSCICNNMFINCRTGIYAGEEFTRNNGNYFFGCIFGIVLRSSNFNSVNNIFVRCDCGMYFLSDNNAHGEVSTFEFAHIGLAGIYAKKIKESVGFIFTNCQFAQAPIIAESSYGLKFSSCRIDTHFVIQAGAKNSIIGNNMLQVYARHAGITNIFDVPSDTVITLNRSMKSSESDSIYNWE